MAYATVNSPFLTRMVEDIRDRAMDTFDAVRWPDEKLYRMIDAANSDIFEEMARAVEPLSMWKISETNIPLVAGQSDYAYPGNFRKFVKFVHKNSSGVVDSEILPVAYQSNLSGLMLFDKPRGFRVNPTPTVSDSDWYLVYEPGAIPNLSTGTVASPLSTSIVLMATPTIGITPVVDDHFNECAVRIVSGTGVGQTRRITDYVGSTRVATISPAWGTTPDTNSVYEIMPCLEYPDDEAIAWQCVMRLKAADTNSAGYQAARVEYERCMRRVLPKVSDLQKRVGPGMVPSFIDPLDFGDYATI